MLISISIVIYWPQKQRLYETLRSLGVALKFLKALISETGNQLCSILRLVDNGSDLSKRDYCEALANSDVEIIVLSGHGNVGYGQGHNLAIAGVQSQYHLVLNPDVRIDKNALWRAIHFFNNHVDIGLVTPLILDDEGNLQHLCRQYPTVADLLLRGFIPEPLKKHFYSRLARYEMHDALGGYNIVWDPLIVSGCFMLFRTDVFKKLHGFDSRYFLYFEDYDLSLRTHAVTRIAYVPSVRIVHYGGRATRKGFKHIRMFALSAFKFFNRFGWKWL
ncbi:glycosyltransferase [Candidatus Vallotiella sp. (ex Adelges kitamiensis)]|uniref:glycosyltransferase n=1 Tax=Candidatus Vallotiella sp. (ex Adelges kitamiensis) TaxID=2864217 RepID=UPI001CE28C44|nr:glycosyltransferase [Candidatus Vallotia sp. (ex Adelges kitamiensis)]